MADGFDAGSIFISLRAQLAEFNAGIESAKKTLDTLGAGSKEVEVAFTELDTSVQVFTEIETRTAQTRKAFASMGAESNRTTEALRTQTKATDELEKTQQRSNLRWAQAANRIVAVQIALLTLGHNATGPIKEAFQALSNGLNAATAAFQGLNSIAPGVLSKLGAGLVGVGVAAVSVFTRYLEESIKATDESTEQTLKMLKSVDALKNAIGDADLVTKTFGGTTADTLLNKLRLSESAFAANAKRIREISDEIAKLTQDSEGRLLPFLPDSSIERIKTLRTEQNRLNLNQDSIRATAQFDKANADIERLLQSTRDLGKELENIQITGKKALDFGIAEPSEVASRNLQESRAYFEKLLDDNVKIVDESNKYNISLEQRLELLKKLHPLSELQGAANRVKSDKLTNDQIKAVNNLASTFSTAIGDGLRDAILNAKKPMEALAGIGQNLFGNMIDQTVKRLETGLTEAFKSITGAAGEGIGLAITGILGVAGGILSRLGSKSSQNFNAVKSGVTSSAAVRGIVAGPSSVAIASVGENLERAVQPLLREIQGSNGWLSKIEFNTRARGGGIGGPSIAGSVATT